MSNAILAAFRVPVPENMSNEEIFIAKTSVICTLAIVNEEPQR